MWRQRVLVCALLIDVLSGRARAQAPVLIGFLDFETRTYVLRAVAGATARLARPPCQEIFGDFSDGSGQRLSARFAASGKTAAEAFAVLRVFEDRDAKQCFGGTRLAFTEVGSQLIRVCGPQFKDQFLRDRRVTELIMIHELLHTFGLGENPPSSEQISAQVAVRCGD
jgi:hypothetical protein